MFILNLKINHKMLYRGILIILFIIILLLTILACKKVFSSRKVQIHDEDSSILTNISANNYTDILELVHNDLDNFIGKPLKFSGYVYRVYDFEQDQFVLARNMIISTDFQTMVVGFLCSYKDINKFEDNTWVEIEGIIEKADYYGEIPIIKVNNIKKIEAPENQYVYPPNSK